MIIENRNLFPVQLGLTLSLMLAVLRAIPDRGKLYATDQLLMAPRNALYYMSTVRCEDILGAREQRNPNYDILEGDSTLRRGPSLGRGCSVW